MKWSKEKLIYPFYLYRVKREFGDSIFSQELSDILSYLNEDRNDVCSFDALVRKINEYVQYEKENFNNEYKEHSEDFIGVWNNFLNICTWNGNQVLMAEFKNQNLLRRP